jgi:hypothetical protein
MSTETANFVVAMSVSTASAFVIYSIWWQSVECMCL